MDAELAVKADMLVEDPTYSLLWGDAQLVDVVRWADAHGRFGVRRMLDRCCADERSDEILERIIPALCTVGRKHQLRQILTPELQARLRAQHLVHILDQPGDYLEILKKVAQDAADGHDLPSTSEVRMDPYWIGFVSEIIARPDDMRAWESIKKASRGHILSGRSYPLCFWEPIDQAYYWGSASIGVIEQLVHELFRSMVNRQVLVELTAEELASPITSEATTSYSLRTLHGKSVEKNLRHQRPGWVFAATFFAYEPGRALQQSRVPTGFRPEGHMALRIAAAVSSLERSRKKVPTVVA